MSDQSKTVQLRIINSCTGTLQGVSLFYGLNNTTDEILLYDYMFMYTINNNMLL